MQTQWFWQHLKRQASALHLRHRTGVLQSAFSRWVQLTQVHQQARQRAQHAQRGMLRFQLQRMLLGWYYCTHNAKLAQANSQLSLSCTRQAQLQEQAGTAQQALDELRLERAELHRRLERVADQAKLQVAQLAVANTQMEALQQQEREHQHLHIECQRLQATVSALQRCSQQQAQEAKERLGSVRGDLEASREAAAAAQSSHDEMQRTCVSLQRHLGKRKAAMQACFHMLPAGHG